MTTRRSPVRLVWSAADAAAADRLLDGLRASPLLAASELDEVDDTQVTFAVRPAGDRAGMEAAIDALRDVQGFDITIQGTTRVPRPMVVFSAVELSGRAGQPGRRVPFRRLSATPDPHFPVAVSDAGVEPDAIQRVARGIVRLVWTVAYAFLGSRPGKSGAPDAQPAADRPPEVGRPEAGAPAGPEPAGAHALEPAAAGVGSTPQRVPMRARMETSAGMLARAARDALAGDCERARASASRRLAPTATRAWRLLAPLLARLPKRAALEQTETLGPLVRALPSRDQLRALASRLGALLERMPGRADLQRSETLGPLVRTLARRAELRPLAARLLAVMADPDEAHTVQALDGVSRLENARSGLRALGLWCRLQWVEIHGPRTRSLSLFADRLLVAMGPQEELEAEARVFRMPSVPDVRRGVGNALGGIDLVFDSVIRILFGPGAAGPGARRPGADGATPSGASRRLPRAPR